jgi:hypothetical protein
MTNLLKDHPVWQNLNQALSQLEPDQIAVKHLQNCGMQLHGYWDEDNFYETVSFSHPLQPQLVSSSLGVSPSNPEDSRWLQLKFLLNVTAVSSLATLNNSDSVTVGDLILILNEGLEVIDENWLIDLQSPHVIALPG